MDNQRHHIFCNFQRGPVKTCRQCIGLFARYPINAGETGTDLVARYFPDVIVREGTDQSEPWRDE